MSILNKIVEKKKERLNFAKTRVPLPEIKSIASDVEKPRDFKAAINRESGPIRLVAEIKKSSPLKGVIRQDFNPFQIASLYESKDVDAISVLTEEDYFLGKLEYLGEIKKITKKPLLRKDFLFDEYQIYESRAHKADAILLIAAILDKNKSNEYVQLAKELGLSVLFEIHDFKELEIALLINADIIGINNRDLKTLSLDIHTTFELKKEIPPHKIIVSESGIKTQEDVRRLEDAGIDAMLIGTAFMEAEDIGKTIDELRGKR